MIWAAAAPLLLGLVLARYSHALARTLKPSTAVRLLTGLSITVAACGVAVLLTAAVLACAQLGPIPNLGGWSAQTLHSRMGFPEAAGVVALFVVVYLIGAASLRAVKSMRLLRSARRTVCHLEPATDNLVLIDDEAPVAYSVAGRHGRHGRIVVSTSMLAALSASERRVVIAHENSHLVHRHHVYAHLADLATAANPLLRPTADAIKRSIERWADEDAAVSVGDRVLTGQALARAALASAGRPAPRRGLGRSAELPGLALATDHVADRVARLLEPAPVRKRWPVLFGLGVGLISWVATVALVAWAEHLMLLAEQVYRRH